MTKEYTGPKFEVEFARAWLKYVEGGKVGVDPRTQWEGCNPYGIWFCVVDHPSCHADHIYRWKPAPKRMVKIAYFDGTWIFKELVAPEVEAPAKGVVYWMPDLVRDTWTDHELDTRRLKSGEVFLAREDAQAMADWLATCRKGGQS